MSETQRKFECYDCKHEWKYHTFADTVLTKETEESIVSGVERLCLRGTQTKKFSIRSN